MKKVYFLLIGLFLFSGVNAQIANIPSTGLFDKLMESSPSNTIAKDLTGSYFKIDVNNDGKIQVSEALNVKELDFNYSQLYSMEGILNFTNLTVLNCAHNSLQSLDVSDLINLKYLYCGYNSIGGTIDLSGAFNLIEFNCSYNQISNLYIKNGRNEVTDFSGNPFLTYICADESQVVQVKQQAANDDQNQCVVSSYCTFTPGGVYYKIEGNAKFDINNNGCDLTDLTIPNLRYNVTVGAINGSLIANSSGLFTIYTRSGTNTITPILENPTYFNISPTSTTVDFPSQASPFTQDFCITANGVHPDLEIALIPLIRARPGFDATYKIIYKNKGTESQSGSVNLTFDDAVLDFVSANLATANQVVNNLSWDYSNLLPFETREILLTLNVNSPTETPAINSDDILDFTATITSPATDDTPNDNTIVFHQTVVNSLDPNDKTCIEGTTISPTMVGEYVHYVIRFENTGTYPAQNIVVKDMIDMAKFDINTLIPIKGSHEFVTNITAGNKVEFIFENINLPFDDANNDGFVAFKIKTKSSLVVGDTFTNSANIYFDYNFPILTNTYTTTVQTLGKQDFDFAKYFTVYPNPSSNTLNLSVKNGIVVNSIAIYNTLGQLVVAIPNAQLVSNIDVSNLKKGNYFIKMTTDKGTSNTKFIKN